MCDHMSSMAHLYVRAASRGRWRFDLAAKSTFCVSASFFTIPGVMSRHKFDLSVKIADFSRQVSLSALCVWARVRVCVIMKKKEPDERQAQHATRTECKERTRTCCKGPFHQSIIVIRTRRKREVKYKA